MKIAFAIVSFAILVASCQGSYFGLSRTIEAQSPLHDAAAEGNTAEAARLIKDGISPDIEVHEGITPLMVAAQYGRIETATLLLDTGANVNHQTVSGASALFMAAQNGLADMVRLLVARGAALDPWAQAGERLTPLLTAVQHGHRDVVRILLSHGANPLNEAGGMNAAELARRNGHDGIADLVEAFVTARAG